MPFRLAVVTLTVLASCTPGSPEAVPIQPTTASPEPTTPSRDCSVLCISDTEVHPGQVVAIAFKPPPKHIWGVAAELRFNENGEFRRIGWLYGYSGAPKLVTAWPQPNLGFDDIGFYGDAQWEWHVPRRLEPGTYEVVKTAISDAVGTLEERTLVAKVRFVVVPATVSTFAGKWRLTSGYGPKGHVGLVAGAPITFQITGSNAGGTAACNNYGGPVVIDGSSFKTKQLTMTLMGCSPHIQRSEQAYIAAFRVVDTIVREGDLLTLSGPGAKLVFELLSPD